MIDGEDNLNQFFELPIKNENQLNIFLDSVNEKAFGENHSLFRWKRVVSSEKIQEYLVKNQLIKDRKDFVNIKITQRGFSGRVIKMEIQVSNSNKMIVLERDDIRRILNFLPSTLFTINKLNDNYWIFKGGGFGHGVGLSQSGAIEMAEMGFTYEQILIHYYRGKKIKKIEILSQ